HPMHTALFLLALLTLVAASGLAITQGPAQPAPAPPPAHAPQTVAVHLEFSLGPGAERCPDEGALHEEVARRSGYNPFAPDAKGAPAGTLTVRIARSPPGLTATYDYVDAAGVKKWRRRRPTPGRARPRGRKPAGRTRATGQKRAPGEIQALTDKLAAYVKEH